MTWPHIAPEDVSAEDTRAVLEALNRAQTASEIAGRVEFPDELDVGLGVAQRILDRRAQLGSFTTLSQVAAVPLVGPERFTEIVLALTGRTPFARDPAEALAALQREVASLRRAIAGLVGATSQVKVELRRVGNRPYLGQAATVIAQARHAQSGTPAIDVPLTLVTTWGALRSLDGYTVQRGTTVTARTNRAGEVRVTILPPTAEGLSVEQQNALDKALSVLDPGAATPRDAREGLAHIAELYRKREQVQLRAAIDIYFRRFSGSDLERTNARDPLAAWPTVGSTVVAYVREGDGGAAATSVAASAALTILYRSWLGAWMDIYKEVAESLSTFDQTLSGLLERGQDPGYLLPAAYGRIEQFVTGERGLVGGHFARRIAERSVRRFVETSIVDLPESSRVILRQGLKAARDTLSTSNGVGTLGGIAQTQNVLQRQTKAAVSVAGADIAAVSQEVAGLEGRIDQTDRQLDAATSQLAALDRNLSTFRSQTLQSVASINQTVSSLDESVNSLNATITRIDTDVTGIKDRLELELPAFATGAQVAALEARVNRSVNTLEAQVNAKVDATAFKSFQTRVNTDLTRVGRDIDDLKRRPIG